MAFPTLALPAARHAARLEVKPKGIRYRDQITRWGSCTTTGHLSFSWRLIMAPPLVLDYLAAQPGGNSVAGCLVPTLLTAGMVLAIPCRCKGAKAFNG